MQIKTKQRENRDCGHSHNVFVAYTYLDIMDIVITELNGSTGVAINEPVQQHDLQSGSLESILSFR